MTVMNEVDEKFGLIDKKGNWLIEPEYELSSLFDFSEGLAPIDIGKNWSDPKWGYIDYTGNFVIEPKYYNASQFSEGLACVETPGKTGYINTKGEYVWGPHE